MEISVEIPNGLTDASNGKFVSKTDLGDGYTRWDWLVHYPINNYDVSLNIGAYEHFSDKLGDLPLDFYALPEDLEKAKSQFAQAKEMLEAYQHYFGEYPFKKDGYKLIQAPYTGMEHQSAVTYGNRFINGYGGRDWTGVGISPKFDFIIIHESAHEWFGNAITAADRSDMWIHEAWATYLECLYVEFRWGKEDGLKYLNGYKTKVRNTRPIVAQRGVNQAPPEDQYFKGALFINTLRSLVDDDKKWFALLHDFFQHFKYRNIMTEDVVQYFNEKLEYQPDAGFRRVSAARGFTSAGTEIRRGRGRGFLPLEGRRSCVRNAGARGSQRSLADRAAHLGVADHEDAAQEGRVSGGDGPVLRGREQVVNVHRRRFNRRRMFRIATNTLNRPANNINAPGMGLSAFGSCSTLLVA